MRWRRLFDPRAYGRRLRRLYIDAAEGTGFSKLLQAGTGRLDLVRLRSALPELRGWERLAAEAGDGFRSHFERYRAEARVENMMVSEELCRFLGVLCATRRPRRILDLGSGFSSALFRLYREGSDPGVEIVSVDDSPQWLDVTRAFLVSAGLPAEGLLTWPELLAREAGTFDLVLHDLGNLRTRADVLPDVVRFCRPGGLVVLDDVHSQFYRSSVRRFLRRSQAKPRVYSLRRLTLDRWGRYAMLLAF